MDKILGVWVYIQARLAEPSTHASIASLLTLAGLQLDTGVIHDALVTLGIVFGGLGFFVKEAKPLSTVK